MKRTRLMSNSCFVVMRFVVADFLKARALHYLSLHQALNYE
ncbi:hypothetical protein [Cytobacillus sp. AMY 15.2]|nr:hypothetical protein [Cytobacillus sp. AMY 15.2]